LVDNLEGFPESIRFLKKNTNWAKTVTLFSDILFCKEEYRVAIENYLEPLMNHYVVNTYDEAIAAINLLSNSSKGRAQFFILDNYEATKCPQKNTLEDGAIPALDLLWRLRSAINRCVTICLKNVYLVNDATEQDINSIKLPDGVVLIGKSGKFNKSKHTMAGGSVGLFEGKRIGRAKNLDNLLKEIKQAETRIQISKQQRGAAKPLGQP
jgi:chromosome segregation protein